MQTAVIIDVIAAAVLAGFAYFGAKKGLVRALAGLIAAVFSLVGANLISTALTDQVMKVAAPAIEKRIEAQLDEAIQTRLPSGQMPGGDMLESLDLPIEELLNLLGLDAQARQSLVERAEDTVKEAGVSAASAVVESMAYSVLHGILYMLVFLALRILFQIVIRMLNLLFKLPGLHSLNTLGGGALGLAEGMLLVFVAAFAAQQLGLPVSTGEFGRIFPLFLSHSPLSVLSLSGRG